MKTFSQQRTHSSDIFPFPADGDTVYENPPCLIWLSDKENDGSGYTVTLNGKDGFAREYHSDKAYFSPDEILPAGEYEWDVASGDKMRGKQRFTIAENAVIFERPTAKEMFDAIDETVHPRALFFAEDIPEIIENHKNDIEVLKRNIAVAIEDGLVKPPYDPSFEIGATGYIHLRPRKYSNIMRNYVDRNLVALGLGWRLLGDRTAAEHGKRLLLEISSWNHHDDSLTIFGKGGDEAGLSIARVFAIAYDLLFDVMDEQERQTVLKTLSTVARYTYDRIIEDDFENLPGNSHTGRIPAYLGMMAVMLKGYEDDATVLLYLDTAMQIYGGMFPHYGRADGGWGEGVFYASSYTKWYLPFFLSVERYTGKSYLDRPFYQNLSNFFLHFADRDYENHPFGDGYWCGSEDDEWPGFYAQNPFRVYAEKFGPKEAQDKEMAITSPEIFKLHLLDVFLPKSKAPKHHITREASLAEAFCDTGVLSMRSTFDTKDCMNVMARASKFGSASHSHSDQGSFALFYEGTSLISPSGYFGWGWGTKHHREWTNTTRAHNTIVVDGVGQPTFSEKPVGKIKYCRQDGNIFTAGLDLDKAYDTLDSWERKFTMNADAKTLIVEDAVKAPKAVTLEWPLHSLSKPYIKDGKVIIKRNGITLTVEILSGLTGEIELSDKFDVDLNEGIGDHQKAVMPDQFHIYMKSESADAHNIKVKFTIEKE